MATDRHPHGMSDYQLAQTMLGIFGGRRDVYAVARPHSNPAKLALGKLEYAPVWAELDEAVLLQHIRGERLIGVYPITKEQTVNFFAFDFDGDTFNAALADAQAQQKRLMDAGLITALERSRSGDGLHVWGFLDGELPAADVRRALGPLLPPGKSLSTYDRLYPLQDTVDWEGLHTRNNKPGTGNLIALPFFGGSTHPFGPGTQAGYSSFLHPETLATIPAAEFFALHFTPNAPSLLQKLAKKAPQAAARRSAPRSGADGEAAVAGAAGAFNPDSFDGRPERPIRGFLKVLSQYGCGFLRTCYEQQHDPSVVTEPKWWAALLQTTCFENGREWAHLMSRKYPGYSPAEVDQKFDQVSAETPHGCAYIREHWGDMGCHTCPMFTAPYHVAEKPILDLVQESGSGMEHAGFAEFADLMIEQDESGGDPGIKLGIPGIDDIVTLRRQDMTIIAARPSMGKTAAMTHISNTLGGRGIPCFRFSAEAGRPIIMSNDLAWESGLNSAAIRSDRWVGQQRIPLSHAEKVQLREAAERLDAKTIYTNYTALDPDRIIEIIEHELVTRGIPPETHFVVFFDYAQFGIKKGDESNHERVSRLSTQFKYIAKILNCSVVVMAQLGRQAEGELPDLNDLKESGQLEQDADVVIFLHGKREPGLRSQRLWLIPKQRVGPTGQVSLVFQKDQSRFEATFAHAPEDRGDVLAEDEVPNDFSSLLVLTMEDLNAE